jgi:hypothetical protein
MTQQSPDRDRFTAARVDVQVFLPGHTAVTPEDSPMPLTSCLEKEKIPYRRPVRDERS